MGVIHTSSALANKVVDSVLDNVTLAANTVVLQQCNAILEGSGPTQRIGRTVCLKRVNVFVKFAINSPTADPLAFRVFLVYDAQPNGAFPTYTDIFQSIDANSSAITTDIIHARPNPNTRDRFKVLFDKHTNLPAITAGAAAVNQMPSAITSRDMMFSISKSLGSLGAKFNAATATIGSITTGSVLLGLYANGAGLRYWTNSRLVFSD